MRTRAALLIALLLAAAIPCLAQADDAARLEAEANALVDKGDFEAALPVLERLVPAAERAYGPDDPRTASALSDLAYARYSVNGADGVEALFTRALAIQEKRLDPNDPAIATTLARMGELFAGEGAPARAKELDERALAIREKAFGPDHVAVAESLDGLASDLMDLADYKAAEPLYVRALAIRERLHGPDDRRVASVCNNLALLYKKMGRTADAAKLYERAGAIFEKTAGPDDPETANLWHNLASLYLDDDDLDRAEPLFKKALAALEHSLGPDHPRVALTLNSLATLYRLRADFTRAEPLLTRALAIAEHANGPDHPSVAVPLNTLAALYVQRGDYRRAEPLFERALAIWEKALGPDHPNVATVLISLAEMDRLEGRYERAEQRLTRALAAREKAFGADHPAVAQALTNMAAVEEQLGRDPKTIEGRLTRALEIREKAFGASHVTVAHSLVNLGYFHRRHGDFARAEAEYQRAFEIRAAALGADHPDAALVLANLSELYLASGDVARSVAAQARASDARERDASRNLLAGSERQKVLYLDQTAREYWRTLSMLGTVARGRADAERLALEMVVRRKGRALDAMTQSVEALRARATPEDRALLDELSDARGRVTALTVQGPGGGNAVAFQAELSEARQRVERLEQQVGAHIVALRIATRTVALDDVLRAIPEGASLVELAAYFAYDVKTMTYGERRYAALVATRDSRPRAVDLGDARKIDAAVAELRAALRDRRRNPKAPARALEALVFQPIRPFVGDGGHVIVSPDGELNLVPFAALVDRSGRYLIERYTFTYLSSGRDLLRLADAEAAPTRPLVVANPDFGPVPDGGDERSVRLRPGESDDAPPGGLLDRLAFPPLPGTAVEARRVAAAVPGALVLTGERATKQALVAARAPEILHVATHGFFVTGEGGGADDERTVRLVNSPAAQSSSSVDAMAAGFRDPLLRSGLALAGANRPGGDGLLTALEAAGLDLWGTRLVVLSACDTGVGEIRSGDGVYGLRRALVLAGSESQMISLWPVQDAATRELMTNYYRALGAGLGRGEALRSAQQRLLASRATRHPYFWAAFIESGAWGPFDASAWARRGERQ